MWYLGPVGGAWKRRCALWIRPGESGDNKQRKPIPTGCHQWASQQGEKSEGQEAPKRTYWLKIKACLTLEARLLWAFACVRGGGTNKGLMGLLGGRTILRRKVMQPLLSPLPQRASPFAGCEEIGGDVSGLIGRLVRRWSTNRAVCVGGGAGRREASWKQVHPSGPPPRLPHLSFPRCALPPRRTKQG